MKIMNVGNLLLSILMFLVMNEELFFSEKESH